MVGQRIKTVRKALGMTQTELAKKAGINLMTLSKIENVELHEMKTGTLVKIAQALNVSTDFLLCGKC